MLQMLDKTSYPNRVLILKKLSSVSGFCGDVFNIAFNALRLFIRMEMTYKDLIDKISFKVCALLIKIVVIRTLCHIICKTVKLYFC